MCIFSSPKVPKVDKPIPTAPRAVEPSALAARKDTKRRAAAMGSRQTMLSGGALTAADTQKKTLLGQ